jgi:DNA-binding transcriptional LysR family regulator
MNPRDALEADGLRSFAVFAEHRNFTAAAAALRISQPSLHVKIRRLGEALGVDLYERHGRQLSLTPAGEALAALALDTRRRLDDFLRELHNAATAFTITAGRGTFRWVLPAAMRRIGNAGRRLQVITADRDSAIATLVSGRADLAVIAYDPPPLDLEAVEIAVYPQILVIGSGHPLARRARVRLADLAGLDLVVPPVGRPHRRALERALLEAGTAWRPVAEVDGWDLLVQFAALGMGATVVNGCVDVPEGLTAVPIRDLPTVRYWAVWRPQRRTVVSPILDDMRQP